jgi:hypothetical protein
MSCWWAAQTSEVFQTSEVLVNKGSFALTARILKRGGRTML